MERRNEAIGIGKGNIAIILVMILLLSNIIYKTYEIYFPNTFNGFSFNLVERTSDYLSKQLVTRSVPLLSYTLDTQETMNHQNDSIEKSPYNKLLSLAVPLLGYTIEGDTNHYATVVELEPKIETMVNQEKSNIEDTEIEEENIETIQEDVSYTNQSVENQMPTSYVYTLDQLKDFNFLINNIYTVDSKIYMTQKDFEVENWLNQDMSVDFTEDKPKILIYHSHSQEAFIDSREGVMDDTVVGLGTLLTEILETEYNVNVMHHKGIYDMVDGRLDRSRAYGLAAVPVSKILEENPSIEVVIDLHRDGVPDHVHLVTEIDGKQTAKIMFFNGISRRMVNGEMVENTYLPNPYVKDNMALSLQMQLKSAELYPGFTRKVYLKGDRYNMHLSPKALLIEVGAQNNTVEEARNAMEPLAQIIYETFSPTN
ncbi:stage II sporulation protein P [Natranaerovirga hydrolytica]|uniref:Stage II sporulation protein P n=1 Tax=Natranaerovirga hydrolytica TaxID=680378 RepID=A0A4R1MYT5_9FIRM|nr:stage II sporulation protein P [Natranaerovirga hydrolytica]TCK98406.1 stage II sporulation protein P [Natranaerovirga hydrolytica]